MCAHPITAPSCSALSHSSVNLPRRQRMLPVTRWCLFVCLYLSRQIIIHQLVCLLLWRPLSFYFAHTTPTSRTHVLQLLLPISHVVKQVAETIPAGTVPCAHDRSDSVRRLWQRVQDADTDFLFLVDLRLTKRKVGETWTPFHSSR